MKWIVALGALALVAACDPAISPANHQQGDRVREQEQGLLAAIAADDAAAAAAFYTPDAQVFIPMQAPQTTPDAIRTGYQQSFDDPNGAMSFTPGDVIMTSAGDYALSEGAFQVTFTDPAAQQPVTIAGHYQLFWRRQDDDSWKIMRDIATPGAPAAAP